MMPTPTFLEKCTTFDGNSVYKTTNEEPELFTKLLGGRVFGKVAGIVSAGEVLFSVLLPRSREVVGVDHSGGSLAVAFLKAILLDTMGAKAFKALLFDSTKEQVIAAFTTAAVHLPQELQKAAGTLFGTYGGLNYEVTALRREWHCLSWTTLERARRRLDKVTMIHGDIMDLLPMGQFSLLYVSNAVDHQGRDRRNPKYSDFSKLVKKGGFC